GISGSHSTFAVLVTALYGVLHPTRNITIASKLHLQYFTTSSPSVIGASVGHKPGQTPPERGAQSPADDWISVLGNSVGTYPRPNGLRLRCPADRGGIRGICAAMPLVKRREESLPEPRGWLSAWPVDDDSGYPGSPARRPGPTNEPDFVRPQTGSGWCPRSHHPTATDCLRWAEVECAAHGAGCLRPGAG